MRFHHLFPQEIKGWNYGIKQFCVDMSGEEPYANDPIYRYSNFLSARLKNSGKTCLEHRYSRVIENLKDTDWESDVAKGGRYNSLSFILFMHNAILNCTKAVWSVVGKSPG